MSGPGVYEPGEEYVPAGIKPLVDEGSLPVAPAAGGEELWLIQIPHDADPADLDGLRFKISDEDAGAEISQFKAGGKKWRLKEEDAITASAMFMLPSRKAGGRKEFGGPRRITRRITMNRRNMGIEDVGTEEGGAKTPGEKKEKKRKKDKDEKTPGKKSSKKAKK